MIKTNLKFMKDKTWYKEHNHYHIFILTKEAPLKVYKSYKNYLKNCLKIGFIIKREMKEIKEKIKFLKVYRKYIETTLMYTSK